MMREALRAVTDELQAVPVMSPQSPVTGTRCADCDCGGVLIWADCETSDHIRVWHAECDECGSVVGTPRVQVDAAYRTEWLLRSANLPAHAGREITPHTGIKPAITTMLKIVRDWPEVDTMPVLIGTPGTGKTHIVSRLLHKLVVEHGVRVMYTTLGMLLDHARLEMDDPSGNAQKVFDRAAKVDLLALDDIGAERPTDWALDRLARLIDDRSRNDLPVVAASNIPVVEWADHLGERTASRLLGMLTPVTVAGDDRRQR